MLVLFAAVACFAADVSGTWKGVAKSNEGGEFPVMLVLKMDGNNLTGTFTQGKAGEKAIEEAKVNDDEVSFSLTYGNAQGSRKYIYAGKVEGTQLKLSRTIEGNARKQLIVLDKQ